MADTSAAERSWWSRFLPSALFTGLGLLVFLVFSHVRPLLADPLDPILRPLLVAALGGAALWTRRRERYAAYGPALIAFAIAALATSLDLYLPTSKWLLSALGIAIKTPAGYALDKLESSVVIVVTVLALNRLSGNSLGALYVHRGKLGKSLAIGAAAFVVAAAAALPIARWWAPGEAITLARALPWMPWILLFILGNAFNEELLFRALFLRKLEPFMGRFASSVLLAIVFSLHHVGVPYGPQQVLFLAFTFGLALAWCDMMQTTDTLWGSVLFHAGTDIPVVLALYAAL